MRYENCSCFDFLKTVPNKSVNLILIDPPYEISRTTNFQSGELTGTDTDRFRVSMDFGDWDKNFTGLEQVFEEGYRILVDGGTMICFYDLWKISTIKEYFENNRFKQIRFIEWLKTKGKNITCLPLKQYRAKFEHLGFKYYEGCGEDLYYKLVIPS